MKIVFTFSAILLSLVLGAQSRVMTFNLRYNNAYDGENRWALRKAEVVDLINRYQPDVLGVQEALFAQIEYLDSNLQGYTYIGVGRDDGAKAGEYAAIVYDTAKVELIHWENYWLSPFPDQVSVGWDAAMPRVVTYAQFRDQKSGKQFHVFNAHFDHRGEEARLQSAQFILAQIEKFKIQEERIIVMGDLNAEPNSPPLDVLKTLLKDSFEASRKDPQGPIGTFNGFQSEPEPSKRIDYILVLNLKVKSYQCIDDRRSNDLWPSDHMPVLVQLKS